jgi:polyhydroxyalkanoate synthesis repressor PhaR
MNPPQPQDDPLRIRKYPNRRFYDATHSRHVTLDGLHKLVRAGHRIEVTDAEGRDITNVVLTQILLEHDPPKLDLFPAGLLHQALQANEEMVRRFIDEYFSKAMDLFIHSRKQFDAFLAQSGLSPMHPLTPFDWARKFLQGFGQRGSTVEAPRSQQTIAPQPPATEMEALRAELDGLKRELSAIASKRRPASISRPASPRRKPRKTSRRR